MTEELLSTSRVCHVQVFCVRYLLLAILTIQEFKYCFLHVKMHNMQPNKW